METLNLTVCTTNRIGTRSLQLLSSSCRALVRKSGHARKSKTSVSAQT